MAIYIKKNNQVEQTTALMSNKTIKSIYVKQGNEDAVCVWGDDLADSLFTYTIQNNSVTITGLNPNYQFSGNLSIPDAIKGKQVKSIGNYAFSGCTGLTSVTIPDSVTYIGYAVFSGCSSLERITIPFVGSDVVSATEGTYYPIGHIFGSSSYDGGVATKQYQGNIESSQGLSSTTYYIPSSLKSVTVTGGNILNRVFYNCTGFTHITIPDSATSIGGAAFYNCTGLTSVTIGSGVTSIGYEAFRYCTNLTSIYYTGDIAGWCRILGHTQLMAYISSSKTLYIGGNKVEGEFTIPDSATSIDARAFYGCTGITSITIPSGVTNIDINAFAGCTELTIVNWNATECTSAGSFTYPIFESCSNLATVNIGDNVTTIPSYVFKGCAGLTSVTIPDSVKSIDGYAFYDCSSLTSITFNGTIAQWNAISKGTNWNYNTGNYTIHCTDGDIPKQ